MWFKRTNFYYGWVIVGIAFICLGIGYSLRYSFSIFPVELEKQFGWQRAEIYFALSVTLAVYGGAGPFAGYLLDRLSCRIIFPIGALVLGLGFFSMSQISQLWHFYLYSGVAGFGMALIGLVPSSTLISRWFENRRGAAMGAATCGTGMGMAIISGLLVPWVIDIWGFRIAYTVMAVMAVGIVIPLSAFFLRDYPDEVDKRGDNPMVSNPVDTDLDVNTQLEDSEWQQIEWTIRRAIKTSKFWTLFLTAMILPFGVYSVMFHQVQYAVDLGYSVQAAGGAFGLLGIWALVGKFSWGTLSDYIGRELAFSLGISCVVVSIFILSSISSSQEFAILYLYSGVFGLGYGVIQPVMTSIVADLFQGRNFGSIFGTINIAGAIGGAAGPVFSGLVFDILQSYKGAFTVAVVLLTIAIGMVWVVRPGKIRSVQGQVK